MKLLIALISFNLFASDKIEINIENSKLNVEKILETDDVIWGFDFLNENDSEIIFSKRDGQLVYYDFNTKKMHILKGVPQVDNNSQGGLLDVLYDRKNKDLYLTYSCLTGKEKSTCLFKAKFNKASLEIIGSKIFEANAKSSNNIHYGSRLLLTDKNELFMTIGDRNEREKSQRLDTHNGKILRLTTDGKPFIGNPFENKPLALKEIYSYGHRNPQGITQNLNGDLLEVEFGPRGGDEVNLIKPGLNYGWPLATHGKEYWGPKIGKKEVQGMEKSLKYWDPSISPSGAVIYKSDVIKGLKGSLLLANLSGSHLRRVVFSDKYDVVKEEKYLENLEDRFRQVKESPSGNIYISTDSGIIYKISNK